MKKEDRPDYIISPNDGHYIFMGKDIQEFVHSEKMNEKMKVALNFNERCDIKRAKIVYKKLDGKEYFNGSEINEELGKKLDNELVLERQKMADAVYEKRIQIATTKMDIWY